MKKYGIIALLLIFLLTAFACNSKDTKTEKTSEILEENTQESVQEESYYQGRYELLNLPYGTGKYNTYDMYLPLNIDLEKEYNVVLLLHGGSWQYGKKEDMEFICRKLRQDDLIAITMNYTLLTKEDMTSNVNTMLDEITDCITNIDEYLTAHKIKTKNIAIGGYSAGAHLASLYCFSKPDESAIPIKFLIDAAGPVDFNDGMWEHTSLQSSGELDFAIYHLAATDVKNVPEEQKQKAIDKISPVYFINKQSVPVILAYGENDTVIGSQQLPSIMEKLDENNIEYEYINFGNYGHEIFKNEEQTKILYEKINEFFAK